MLVNYEILTVRLNRYLSEQYPDVTTHTDIFEHAFLRFLGYQSVPEKCLFEDNQPNHSLSIYLKAPYNIANLSMLYESVLQGAFQLLALKKLILIQTREYFALD